MLFLVTFYSLWLSKFRYLQCLCVCKCIFVCGFVIRSSWHKKNGDVSNYITDFAASLR